MTILNGSKILRGKTTCLSLGKDPGIKIDVVIKKDVRGNERPFFIAFSQHKTRF